MAAKKKAVEKAVNNLEHWEVLERTDPAYTKKFNAGRFKGTDINATYRMRHLTERFGPAGKGFGFNIGSPIFYGEGDLQAVTISAELWWVEDGHTYTAPAHYGGTKIYLTSKGSVTGVDEDAVKKAVTDAMGKAALAMGAHADVYMGLHDDSKYLKEITNEIAAEARDEPEVRHQIASGDMDGDLEDPNDDWADWLTEVSDSLFEVKNPADFRKWARKEKDAYARAKVDSPKTHREAMKYMLKTRLHIGMMTQEEHDEAINDMKGS